MRRWVVRATASAAALGVLVLGTSGCGIRIPTDPDGTLDRIASSGEVRAGASPADGVVDVHDDSVTGPLVELVEQFARDHDAEVEWTVGSEEELVDGLESGELDLAIGGMTDATIWTDRASATRGYRSVPGSEGRPLVILLPLGENALQTSIETFLDEEIGP